jgi:hypothetical protein
METGLYEAGRPDAIDSRNRPFSPQYPLWSDGAVKSRWVEHSDILDGDAIAAALLAKATVWQVPGQPEGVSRMLCRERPEASAMLFRMKSRRPSSQMPPLGTVMRDEAAIAAVANWIEKR